LNPNRLRILGGIAKGKKINSPDVYLRPMMGKVREALFSTLNFMDLFQSNGTRVLDIFAGSGSIGLEAISRGASHATFIDFSKNCVDTVLSNAELCGFGSQVSAVCTTAQEFLRDPVKYGQMDPYDVITLTPPYEEVVYADLVESLCNSPCVAPDTVVAIEYPIEMGTMPYILGQDKFFGVRNRRYGRTVLALYVYRPNKKFDMRSDEFVSLK
jgi:16S rRNA (guanine(966)-N(2))-methyltransferase RsmD